MQKKHKKSLAPFGTRDNVVFVMLVFLNYQKLSLRVRSITASLFLVGLPERILNQASRRLAALGASLLRNVQSFFLVPFGQRNKKKEHPEVFLSLVGLPERIRTFDLQSRSLTRYPAVPRAEINYGILFSESRFANDTSEFAARDKV